MLHLNFACFEALNLPYSTQESSEEAPQDNFTDFLRNFPNEFVLISPDLDRGGSSRAGGRRKEINRVRGMRLGYLLCRYYPPNICSFNEHSCL